ncbi:hypothetical protein [Paenibacillus sp. WLX2291]|uniref:hypothetical protein n=1 Tax=Paenibacillus sp. WLX2291 TaxID=3296934 RepID=UPI00398435B2
MNQSKAARVIRSWKRQLWQKINDTRGAVTIFLIVVLAGVFTFTAVFIDYARIAAMQVQTERLTHALVRSVMSAYEPEYQTHYGLFAFGGSDANQLLDTAIAENMNYTDVDNRLNLIPLQVKDSSIALSRPLGKYDVFNQQVQEEMKYKAPIDFTVEVVEKMRSMSSIMKETTQTTEVLNNVRAPYERREKAIDELLTLQKNAAKDVLKLAKMVMYPAGNSIADKNVGSISSLADIAAQFDNYTDLIAEDKKRKKKDKPAINTQKISKYKNNAASLLEKIMPEARKLITTHKSTYDEGMKLMEKIREENGNIKEEIRKARTRSANGSYNTVSGTNTPGSTSSSANSAAESQIAELRKNLDQLVLSEELLNRMDAAITSQQSDYGVIKTSLEFSVGEAQQVVKRTSGSAATLKSKTIETARLLEQYLNNYRGLADAPSGKMGKIEKDIADARKGTDTVAQDEAKAKQSMKKATAVISAIAALGAGAQASGASFDKVNEYYQSNLNFNQAIAAAEEKMKQLNEDPYEESTSSMGAMDFIYGGIADVLMKSRNEFYMNEYAVHYFEPFDVMMWGNLVESVQKRDASLAGDFPISEVMDQQSIEDAMTLLTVDSQQLEYIIYGYNGPVANLTAAYTEIFGMRMAIRTAEGLAKNARLGHPLAVLAAGIAYGVEMALKDMIDLFTKGYTDLSGYLKVHFEYRDYLRLFLLQTNNEKKMSRMLALIRYNTDINPQERDTYASAHIQAGMRIWFLPAITGMLQSVQTDSSVKQGVYYEDKQADFSY